MDLYDDAALPNVYAMLELPGITPNNISVQIYQGKLIITGYRGSPLLEQLQREKTLGGHNPQVAGAPGSSSLKTKELRFGRFHREIVLPENCAVRLVSSSPCPNFCAIVQS